MIIPLIVMGLLVWFVWYYTKQVKAGPNYTSKFFDQSPNSRLVLEKMDSDLVSDDSKEDFAIMEDRLLMLMNQLYPNLELARAQSDQIKNRFKAYDFDYHEEILAQRLKFLDFSHHPTTIDFVG